MLRRVTQFLRVGLLGLGMLVLAWWPFSCVYIVFAQFPFPFRGTNVNSARGILSVTFFRDLPFSGPVAFETRHYFLQPQQRGLLQTAMPQVTGFDGSGYVGTSFIIPLWLLAAVCLTWPVTSLLLALLARRRGKGRGFAVEARGGGPAPGIDPPPRRPDNLPPQ